MLSKLRADSWCAGFDLDSMLADMQMNVQDLGPRMRRLHQERATKDPHASKPCQQRGRSEAQDSSAASAAAGPLTDTAGASKGSQAPVNASLQLEGAEYEAFVANVAASIIQQRWRQGRGEAQEGGGAGGSYQSESCMPEQASASEAGSCAGSSVQLSCRHLEALASPRSPVGSGGGAGSHGREDIDQLLSRYRSVSSAGATQPRSSLEIVQNAEAIVKAAGLPLRASGAPASLS